MLSKNKIEEQINYWLETSKNDLMVMETLYKDKKYPWCLFFGHLVLEKILKALVVQHTGKLAPKTHNLRSLEAQTSFSLSIKEIELIAQVTDFNMEARYPEVKMQFNQLCTKSYTDQFYKPILSLYKKLCQKIK